MIIMRCNICGKDIDEARNESNCNEVYQAFICQECYDKKTSNVPQGGSVNTLLADVAGMSAQWISKYDKEPKKSGALEWHKVLVYYEYGSEKKSYLAH
jgi:hypothetical protein